jgi:signal transduction histidine kinase
MKAPSFLKTIRFRLTLWYSMFLVLVLAILVIGINIALIATRPPIPSGVPFPGDNQTFQRIITDERTRNMEDLRNYSLIGVGTVLLLGAVGGYFLSGFMLTPIDKVSSIASRISHTNLKERIKYTGPDDEVKRLADTFDDMLGRLEEAFETQKRFVQDASHELRTPIAIAQTNIEVFEMEKTPTEADYEGLVDVLKSSLERMSDVNNSLLLLSEDPRSRAKWARIEINPLLNEVYEETRAEAIAAGLPLRWMPLEQECLVFGDAVRIKGAVINLIDNAVKYNRPGGAIELSAIAEGDKVNIRVKDTGIGISADDLPHLFERFFRVDKSRSREKGGSGLGLAIVKKIAEDHGGSVSAESAEGQGSKFTITLPLVKE